MNLRPYQTDLLNRTRSALARSRRVCVQAPTGAGKTILAAEMIRRAREKRKTVLFIAPRRELVTQASEKLHDAHGIIMAGEPKKRLEDVQVASFDTLVSQLKSKKLKPPPADLVIVDEAHLAVSPRRQETLALYPDAHIVGLTATPARSDGRALGEIFDDLVMGPDLRSLIADGFLVQPKYFAPSQPDLDGIKVRMGDYAKGQLAERMDKPQLVGDVVDNWMQIAKGKQTVVFCVNRRHARHVQEEFLQRNVFADYVDGETETHIRKKIMDRMRSGETTVLVNVMVATFGLDIPSLEVAVLARPTKSLTLYVQAVGRVLRPFEGKDSALIIDHSGAVHEHGFVEDPIPWSLEGGKVQERQKQEKERKKEAKEMTCTECGYVFRASRRCPSCGHQQIPEGKDVPVWEAKLEEIKKPLTAAEKRNRSDSIHEKQYFHAELSAFGRKYGYSPLWADNQYKARFGVFPNKHHKAFRKMDFGEIRESSRSWIKYQQIRYAKRAA